MYGLRAKIKYIRNILTIVKYFRGKIKYE